MVLEKGVFVMKINALASGFTHAKNPSFGNGTFIVIKRERTEKEAEALDEVVNYAKNKSAFRVDGHLAFNSDSDATDQLIIGKLNRLKDEPFMFIDRNLLHKMNYPATIPALTKELSEMANEHFEANI